MMVARFPGSYRHTALGSELCRGCISLKGDCSSQQRGGGCISVRAPHSFKVAAWGLGGGYVMRWVMEDGRVLGGLCVCVHVGRCERERQGDM